MNTKEFIQDIIAASKKVSESAEKPSKVLFNPALLTPERLPSTLAICELHGMAYDIELENGAKLSWNPEDGATS